MLEVQTIMKDRLGSFLDARNHFVCAPITFSKSRDSITGFHKNKFHIGTSLLIVKHLVVGLQLNPVICWRLLLLEPRCNSKTR